MARKSRNNLPKILELDVGKPIYKVGIYSRVSVAEQKNWSTVDVQEQMAKGYIEKHHDMLFIKSYQDSGVSSFLLHRPAFDQMIADIAGGKINCVIVKDLSRFGREYLSTMEYVADIFPSLNVRFVSLLEQYDSGELAGEDDIKMPLLSLYNYYYSAEISHKVKAVIQLKQKQGSYVPPTPQFGYKKEQKNNTKTLVIDSEQAVIVKMIFEWAANGVTSYQIVKSLNSLGKNDNMHTTWTQKSISRILKNEFYTGTYMAGKTKKLFREDMLIRIPKDMWTIIENHHPAIIDKELFQSVQEQLSSNSESRRYKKSSTPDFFEGKVYCQDCNRKMKRIKRKGNNTDKLYFSYVCPTYLETSGFQCSRKSVIVDRLKKEIFKQIQEQIVKADLYREEQLQYENSLAFKLWVNYRENLLKKLRAELAKMTEIDLATGLYEQANAQEHYIRADFFGINGYRNLAKENLRKQIAKTESDVEDYWELTSSKSNWVQLLLDFYNVSDLTLKMIDILISQIYINSDKKIALNFKFPTAE